MRSRILTVLLAVALANVPAAAPAAGPVFEPLVRLWQPTSLVVVDGRVFCGSNDGGVLVWDEDAPDAAWRWLAGRELSSAAITDLAWTGRHLWVATADGGMTRVGDPAGAPRFDLYANSLRSAEVSAVAGAVFDGTERTWYGAGGLGLGEIIADQPGALYTAETDGLVSNDIRDLVVFGDVLFVATAAGCSRFADGVFRDASTGLTDLDVRVLLVADDALLAGGAGGVHEWDAGAEAWTLGGALDRPVIDLAATSTFDTYALGRRDSDGALRLTRWDGDSYETVPQPASRTEAIAADDVLWLAGREAAPGMAVSTTWPLTRWRREGGDAYTAWRTAELPVVHPGGVTFGADGAPWVADFLADALVRRTPDGAWEGTYALAADDPDSSGLIDRGGNMLAAATGTDGAIWTTQLGAGLLRTDPASGRTDPVVVANSGLASPRVVNLVVHPQGPVILLLDNDDDSGVLVQVIVDPERWRDPGNWATPPAVVVGGTSTWDALVTDDDIVWLAVRGGGLVRWDVNGRAAGPDDPLTWNDFGDDDWSRRVTFFPGTTFDPAEAEALARGTDGTIWVGGNGLVGMEYDAADSVVATVASFGARTLDQEGLISSSVVDVAIDRHGYVWALTAAGLNRVRPAAGGWAIDAWFDVVTYAGNRDLGVLYSPSRVSALPGVSYGFGRLAVDPAGAELLVAASRGVAHVDVGDAQGGGSGGGTAAYLYPNPWDPDRDPRLAVGGLAAAADEYLDVRIYNLEGQLVYRDDRVRADEGFWSGANRVGRPVSTGLYVVRVTWRGEHLVRSLAVVR